MAEKDFYTVLVDLVRGTSHMGKHPIHVRAKNGTEAISEAIKKVKENYKGWKIQGTPKQKKWK